MATIDTQIAGIVPPKGLQTIRNIGRAANTTILFVGFLFVFIVILLLISALNLQRAVAADVDDSIAATVGQVRLDIALLNDLDVRANHDNDVIVEANRILADSDAQMDSCLQAMVSAILEYFDCNPYLFDLLQHAESRQQSGALQNWQEVRMANVRRTMEV